MNLDRNGKMARRPDRLGEEGRGLVEDRPASSAKPPGRRGSVARCEPSRLALQFKQPATGVARSPRTAPVLGRRDMISYHASTQFNPRQRTAASSRFWRQATWPLRLHVAATGDDRAPGPRAPRFGGFALVRANSCQSLPRMNRPKARLIVLNRGLAGVGEKGPRGLMRHLGRTLPCPAKSSQIVPNGFYVLNECSCRYHLQVT